MNANEKFEEDLSRAIAVFFAETDQQVNFLSPRALDFVLANDDRLLDTAVEVVFRTCGTTLRWGVNPYDVVSYHDKNELKAALRFSLKGGAAEGVATSIALALLLCFLRSRGKSVPTLSNIEQISMIELSAGAAIKKLTEFRQFSHQFMMSGNNSNKDSNVTAPIIFVGIVGVILLLLL